jgi:hypothetical protein
MVPGPGALPTLTPAPGPPEPIEPNVPNWLGRLRGGHQILDALAQSLGVTTDQLRIELRQLGPGEGLCTLADKHGVACDRVKNAVRNALRKQLEDAIRAGILSQRAADRMIHGLDSRLAADGILPSLGIGLGPKAGQPETGRAWLGVYYVELDPATAKSLNAPLDYGALVQKPAGSDQPAVLPGSPAAAAGLREGDIIVAVDGQKIDPGHSLRDLVLAHQPGDVVRLELRRNRQPLMVTLTLGSTLASTE